MIENPFALQYREKVALHLGSNNSISEISVKWSVFTDLVTYDCVLFSTSSLFATFCTHAHGHDDFVGIISFLIREPP